MVNPFWMGAPARTPWQLTSKAELEAPIGPAFDAHPRSGENGAPGLSVVLTSAVSS